VSDGTTILRGIVGSVAYGLNHEDSDIDRLGMFVAPTTAFHGLHPPTQKAASRVQTSPSDYTEHEASKYLSLLLSCNPTVTELLWLPDELYEVVHPEGLALIYMRDKFLSANAVRNAYLGYATQQFKKLDERGSTFAADLIHRTEKHARHLKRLCWQGFTLFSEGWLPIKVEDPEEYREFGRQVASAPQQARDLIAQYEQLFSTTESVLPEHPDKEAAEEWLQSVRAKHYDGPVYFLGKLHRPLSADDRAVNYLDHLIRHKLVSYHTIHECQNALDKLTSMFGKVPA
jgi:hypothetical protein